MSLDFRFASPAPTPIVGGPLAFSFKSAQNASGFTSTAIGAPSSRIAQVAQPAMSGALFGIPSIPLMASGWSTSELPEPYASFLQIGGPLGWQASSFGDGGLGSTQINYGQGQLTQAFGFAATVFGGALASWDVSGQVAGIQVSEVGAPSSGHGCAAQGIGPAGIGIPGAVIRCLGSGFVAAQFGQPQSGTVHLVVGQPIGVRFGVPEKRLRCAHDATGLRLPARFGKPKATRPEPRQARGLDVGRRFGRPSTRCHA